ncbi:MAG TPA: GTPase [Chthoniobacterales bacterium]|jgi:small GTP-binding protein
MIADQYLQVRSDLDHALDRLLQLGADLERLSSWAQLVESLTLAVREPLLVVVIGDTQSGKTTLLRALFDHDLPIDSAERISLVQHSEKENTVELSPRFAERYLPLEFLQQFKIVDTPGTEKLTTQDRQLLDDFIRGADLVFLVLSVSNPWTHAIWDFLGAIDKTVLQNIVFVLQQADLRSPGAIDLVRRHLEDEATQKIGFAPPIFAVSARDALRTRHIASEGDRLRVQKQLAALQEQINLVVGQAGGRTQKLRSACQIAQVLLHDVTTELRTALDVVGRDRTRLDRLSSLLQTRKEQTAQRIADLLRKVEQTSRQSSARGLPLLKDKLSIAQTVKTMVGQSPPVREFQLDIDKASRDSIEQQVEETARLLENDLRTIWPQLHDLVDQQLAGEIKTEVPHALPDFAGERRRLLHAVQMAMAARGSGSNVEDLAQLFRRTARWLQWPAAVALLCVFAVVVALKFNPMIAKAFTVVALVAVAAGVAVAFYRRARMVRAYQEQMQRRVAELLEIISWQFNETIDSFHNQIAAGFEPLAAHCAREHEKAAPLLRRAEQLQTEFGEIASRLR